MHYWDYVICRKRDKSESVGCVQRVIVCHLLCFKNRHLPEIDSEHPNGYSLHHVLPPVAQAIRSILRRLAHREVPVPGDDALLGLDSRYNLRIKETLTSCLSSFRRFHLDTADFEHSTFFDNSSHGVSGWGDPENDFQIYTGGFKDVIRAYPNPHHIRRNFTLFPFQMPPWCFW